MLVGGIISCPYPSVVNLDDLDSLEIPLEYKFCILVPNNKILALSIYSANCCKSVAVCGIVENLDVFK